VWNVPDNEEIEMGNWTVKKMLDWSQKNAKLHLGSGKSMLPLSVRFII